MRGVGIREASKYARVCTLVNAGAANKERNELEAEKLYGKENKKFVLDL